MFENCVSDHGVVSLLIQKQLTAVAELWIRLAILVNVRCRRKRPRLVEQIDRRTFAYVKEYSDIPLTSVLKVSHGSLFN